MALRRSTSAPQNPPPNTIAFPRQKLLRISKSLRLRMTTPTRMKSAAVRSHPTATEMVVVVAVSWLSEGLNSLL